MERDSVIFYRSFFEAIEDLPLESQARVYNAIFEYSLNMNEIPLSGFESTIFKLIKPQLDANLKRYANGKKGGKPKQETTEIKPKRNQNVTKPEPKANQDVTELKPGSNQNATKAEPNKNDNVNENKNKNDEGELESKKVTASPPSPSSFQDSLPAGDWRAIKEPEEHAADALTDRNFLSSAWQAGVKDKPVVGAWLHKFNEFLNMQGKTAKNRADYRTHFLNWIGKKPYHERNAPPVDENQKNAGTVQAGPLKVADPAAVAAKYAPNA